MFFRPEFPRKAKILRRYAGSPTISAKESFLKSALITPKLLESVARDVSKTSSSVKENQTTPQKKQPVLDVSLGTDKFEVLGKGLAEKLKEFTVSKVNVSRMSTDTNRIQGTLAKSHNIEGLVTFDKSISFVISAKQGNLGLSEIQGISIVGVAPSSITIGQDNSLSIKVRPYKYGPEIDCGSKVVGYCSSNSINFAGLCNQARGAITKIDSYREKLSSNSTSSTEPRITKTNPVEKTVSLTQKSPPLK